MGVTSREMDVLQLVAEGLTNAAIAERLVLLPRTVETHGGRRTQRPDPAGKSGTAAD